MGEIEHRSKADRRKYTAHRTVSNRNQSIILHHELLDFDRQDQRSGVERRRGKEKRIKSTYILK